MINAINNILYNTRKYLLFILFLAVVIRVFIVQRYYFIGSDDASYLGIAINLLKTGTFTNLSGNWPMYPPLYSMFSAAIYYIFGFIVDLPSKLNFVFFTSFLILPVYYFTRELYGKKEAIIASFLIAFFPTFIFCQQALWSSSEHIEVFFVWMGIYLFWMGLNKKGQTDQIGIIELGLSSACFALAYLSKPEGLLFLPVAIILLIINSILKGNCRLIFILKYIFLMVVCFVIVVSPYWIIQYNNTGNFSISGKGLSALAYGFIINQGGDIEREIYDGTRILLENEIDKMGLFNYVLNNKFLFLKHMVKNAEREFRMLFSLSVFPFYYLPFIGIGLFSKKWDKERLRKEIFLFSMFIPMIVNIPFWIGERHLIVFIPIIIIWLSRSTLQLWAWLQLSIQNIKYKKSINIVSCIMILVLFLTPFFRFNLIRTKPYAIKNVAGWMVQNVPEGEKVYSVKGHYLDLYTLYRYEIRSIDFDLTSDELYSQAIEDGYQWLLFEDMYTFNHHPQMKEIFHNSILPQWLKLKYEASVGGHRAKLYRIVKI